MPLGKIWSPPLVRTSSPGCTGLSVMIFSRTTSPADVPRRTPCRRDFLENRAHAAALIVDQQHLRRGAKHLQHLAHDAVRRDHRHVGLQPVMLPFVDVDDARLLAAARSDHLRRHGLRDELFLEAQQSLQAAGLRRVLVQAHLLQPQALDFRFQFAILRRTPRR